MKIILRSILVIILLILAYFLFFPVGFVPVAYSPPPNHMEIFADELPGYPDNISYNDQGIFWVALPDLRVNDQFEKMYEKPFSRKVITRLPESMKKTQEPPSYGMAVGFDTLGNVVYNLQDPSGNIHDITSAVQVNSTLYLGSLHMKSMVKYELINYSNKK